MLTEIRRRSSLQYRTSSPSCFLWRKGSPPEKIHLLHALFSEKGEAPLGQGHVLHWHDV